MGFAVAHWVYLATLDGDLRLWNLDLRWSLLQKQVVWPNYISSYLFPLFCTVGVDRGLKFYSLIRFAYVHDQATYSLYLFYTILLNFVAQLFPFSNKITEIYFWSIDCCLKSIQQYLGHNTWQRQFYKQ